MKQEAKVTRKGKDFFFFRHNFKSALEHARAFIERNAENGENMDLFVLNEDSAWPRWRRLR